MSIDASQLEVKNNTAAKRFEVTIEGQTAMIEYMLAGEWIIFTHTEVPPAFEGQGIANRMAQVALDYAQAQGLKVQPLCPFVKLYVQKHAQYHPITLGFYR